MTESRTKKTLLNAKYNLFFLSASLMVAFFSRKIFLDCLGLQFVGLTTTVQSLLGFLSVAELGIGTAVEVVLYKPLANDDHEAVNEITSVLGYVYRGIGLAILTGGVVLSFFLPHFFEGNDIDMGICYFAFYAFLFSSLFSYFINYRQVVLVADQRKYVVTKYLQTAGIVKLLLQMTLAYCWSNLYLWVVVEVTFALLACVILNVRINHTYPWLVSRVSAGRTMRHKYPQIATYTRQIFLGKLAGLVGGQLAPVLICSFVSLDMVAYTANYTTITTKFSLLLDALLGSSEASVGNVIAGGDKSKIRALFDEMFSVYFLLAGLFAVLLFYLADPFITLWLGEKYLLSRTILLLLLVDLFIRQYSSAIFQFLSGYGLFRDVWVSVAEIIIYIVFAITGGYFWGLPGILLAAAAKTLLNAGIWKPYFLFSQGMHEPVTGYWMMWFRHMAVLLAVWGVCEWAYRMFCPHQSGWFSMAAFLVVFSVLSTVLLVAAFSLFIPQSRALFKRIKYLKK